MKKIGPGVSEDKLFKGVNRRLRARLTDDGWGVITIVILRGGGGGDIKSNMSPSL